MDRMQANSLTARIVIFALVAALIYWALPDPGLSALRKMSVAMQNARSWRMDLVVTEPTKKVQSTVEVYCPSHFHEVSSTVRDEGGRQFEESSESYWIEGTNFAKRGSKWVTSQEERSRTASCTFGPRATDMLLERLDPIVNSGKVRKGDKRIVNDVPCRDWIASVHAPAGWREEFGVCLGDDGLPREVFAPDRQMVETYSDWNSPIRIEAPIILGAPQ
jgi:hypothetical protein